jgi:hypothetical protein
LAGLLEIICNILQRVSHVTIAPVKISFLKPSLFLLGMASGLDIVVHRFQQAFPVVVSCMNLRQRTANSCHTTFWESGWTYANTLIALGS